MKKLLLSLGLVSAVFFGAWKLSSAQFVAPQPFYKSGTAWIMNKATETLGNASNRISEIWASKVDTTSITIGGASTGNIDMGGFNINDVGTVTAARVVATSTTATSTYAGGVAVTSRGYGFADGTYQTTAATAVSVPVSIANGGTATTTQVTNGINYYDGTKITSGTALTYDGTKLTVGNASSTLSTHHTLFADGTDGLIIDANNGTQVASFGAANTANTALQGGLTVATTLGVTGNSTLATTTVSKNLSVTGGASTGTQVATDAATITVDWQKGNTQEVVLGATGRTLAFSNVTAGTALKLWIWQDGTGSRTITTYPTGTHWAGGTAPTLTTTANKFDLCVWTTATSTTQFSAGCSLNY